MLNNITIIGRLVKAPEVRATTTGKSVCSFTIANNRPKDKDGKQVADYLEVVTWNHTAEFVGKYFEKGSPIVVVGRLQTESYEDKDGIKRKAWKIVANTIDFVPIQKPKEDGDTEEYIPEDGEIPF